MRQFKKITVAGISLGAVLALQGCAHTEKPAQHAEPAAAAPAATAAPVVAAKPAPPEQVMRAVSGKVVEVKSGGGYTFLYVQQDGNKVWAAISGLTLVNVGEEIALKPGIVMNNFPSKALGRVFDEIIFSDGPVQAAEREEQVTLVPQKAVSGNHSGKVAETMKSGSYTFARLEKEGNSVWVALPTTALEVGQAIEVQPGVPTRDYFSKGLNRTFELIYFSKGLAEQAP